MVKLIAIFPHTGDDGVYYEPGMHREVEDHLLEAYLKPVGHLDHYILFESPKPVVSAPVYRPDPESDGAVLRETSEPATILPKVESKASKKK